MHLPNPAHNNLELLNLQKKADKLNSQIENQIERHSERHNDRIAQSYSLNRGHNQLRSEPTIREPTIMTYNRKY